MQHQALREWQDQNLDDSPISVDERIVENDF